MGRFSVRPFVRSSVRPFVRPFVRLSICTVGWLVGCSVSLSLTFWAAAPKGTKSCRTQGDFRSSVRPFVRSSVRPFVRPPPLWPQLTLSGFNQPSQTFGPFRPQISLSRPQISLSRPQDLQNSIFRPQICPLMHHIRPKNCLFMPQNPCVLQDFVPFGARPTSNPSSQASFSPLRP